jgi:Zn-dependent peptidase ImmA (M78 family)/transcriptional regulator with XRE-family HTH domain
MPTLDRNRNQSVGGRIREAREAMGLGVAHLADMLGVSKPMIYGYEEGSRTVPSDKLVRIAVVLDQPLTFFESDSLMWEFEQDVLHFRDAKTTQMQRAQAAVRLKWLEEYFSFLIKKLDVPSVSIPDLQPPSDPTLITTDFIEQAAEQVREAWGLGSDPINNLVNVMERHGIVIGFVGLDIPELDGLSCWSTKFSRPFMVLNRDKASAARSRFDAAHELGHIVLHRNVQAEYADPRKSGQDDSSSNTRKQGAPLYKLMEKQAHRFAGALLLPKVSWGREAIPTSLTRYKNLKARWLVSVAAMLSRAKDLHLIQEDRHKILRKQLSNAGWRIQEPFDDVVPQEIPRLTAQATKLLIQHGTDLTDVFPRRLAHLAEITGLEPPILKVESPIVTLN